MRILHIDKLLFREGGVTQYVRTLADLQRGRGHEAALFGCRPSGARAPSAWPEFVDFTRTRSLRALARMIHNTEAAAKLDRLLRRRPFDVAHLHNIYHHLTPSILPVLARHGCAAVMTLHDYRLACPTKHFLRTDGLCMRCVPNRFHRAAARRCAGLGGAGLAVESFVQRVLRRYFRGVDLFLCPTRFLADLMRRIGAPRSKLAVMRTILRPPCPPNAHPPHDGMLLFAGRLSREKGPDLMLDLAAVLGDAHVTLAGDGPRRAGIEAAVRRRGLGNVTLAGQVAPARVAALMAAAAAVVLPSRCMENSPQTMLEAMAAGRCVVVPDQPPLREWVRDGETGRTFATGDADSMAAVVREVLADAGARRRMAAAGQALVRARHDVDRLCRRLEALYLEASRRCASRW